MTTVAMMVVVAVGLFPLAISGLWGLNESKNDMICRNYNNNNNNNDNNNNNNNNDDDNNNTNYSDEKRVWVHFDFLTNH